MTHLDLGRYGATWQGGKARGPARDKLRNELNNVIYTYNKARGY